MDYDKSFKNWLAQDVEESFGIVRTRQSHVLDRWLTATPAVPEGRLEEVERLRLSAEKDIDAWNEAAIKFFFIGPLVSIVDFNTEGYHGFLEQTLTVSNANTSARGNVDFMVAAGREKPHAPIYLLHEYKPETTAVLDPKGQLLIAMLAARVDNEDAKLTQPVYGSYVIGRLWFFVVLNGNEYTISRAFDCTQPDGIGTIFNALLQVKLYIQDLYSELSARG